MTNTLESAATFPELARLKRELFELRDVLPEIVGRNDRLVNSRAVDFSVLPTPSETIGQIGLSPFSILGSAMNMFAGWFIHRAFVHAGEESLAKISGFCGVVGESGQYLDYLHKDPMPYRITSTAVDLSCPINPSTKTAKFPSDEAILYENQPASSIPEEVFLPQVSEAGIVSFVRNQYHIETKLPVGSVKIFMSATFN